MVAKGEAAGCDEGARNFFGEFDNLIKGYMPEPISNVDKIGLYWK